MGVQKLEPEQGGSISAGAKCQKFFFLLVRHLFEEFPKLFEVLFVLLFPVIILSGGLEVLHRDFIQAARNQQLNLIGKEVAEQLRVNDFMESAHKALRLEHRPLI